MIPEENLSLKERHARGKNAGGILEGIAENYGPSRKRLSWNRHGRGPVRWVGSAAVWLAVDMRIIHWRSGLRNVATHRNLAKGQTVNRHKSTMRHRFSDQPTYHRT
jgi:hypothetical protein